MELAPLKNEPLKRVEKKEPAPPLTLGQAQKKLEALLTAKKAGYAVPKPLLQLVQEQVWKLEGVREVWECKKCPNSRAVLYFPAIEIACRCGKIRRVWQG